MLGKQKSTLQEQSVEHFSTTKKELQKALSENSFNAQIELQQNVTVSERGVDNLKKSQELVGLFDRIKKNQLKLHTNSFDNQLSLLISRVELIKIYQYLIDNESTISNNMLFDQTANYRLNKSVTKLPRTCNIVYDPINAQYVLFLEIKSKLANGTKDPETIKFSGGTKHGKKTVQIDLEFPVWWANMVASNAKPERLLREIREAELSQHLHLLAKSNLEFFHFAPSENKQTYNPIHYSICGSMFEDKNTNSNKAKISVYSPYADLGSLKNAFIEKMEFSEEEKLNFILDFLCAVKVMHDSDVIHQDIKPGNLLIFTHGPRNFLKLIDFGISDNQMKKQIPGGTCGYESPEISIGYQHPHSACYRTFHKSTSSFARQIVEEKMRSFVFFEPTLQEEYQIPSKANDIWAIGITIYELLTNGCKIAAEDPEIRKYIIENNPLLKALLANERTSRCTIDEAINILIGQSKECLIIKRPNLSLAKKKMFETQNEVAYEGPTDLLIQDSAAEKSSDIEQTKLIEPEKEKKEEAAIDMDETKLYPIEQNDKNISQVVFQYQSHARIKRRNDEVNENRMVFNKSQRSTQFR